MESQAREKQIQELDEWIHSRSNSRELKITVAVKLALQGWAYRAIAEALNVSTSFIRKWKKHYESKGISELKLSYQGAVSYLTSHQKQEVIKGLECQEHWSLSKLECYLVEQYDVVFKSATSYYELLKAARKTWQKAQKKPPRQNPEVVKKRLQEIKLKLEELMPDIRDGKFAAYAIDEVRLLKGDLISHLWGDSQNRLHFPILNEKNRQTYYRALDLLQSELIFGKYDKGNGDCIVEFVKKLIQKNPKIQYLFFGIRLPIIKQKRFDSS